MLSDRLRIGKSMLRRADFAPLAEPNFRCFWIGRTVSSLGDGMVPVATAFAVLTAGGTATTLGLVLASGQGARIAATLAGGVIADRRPSWLVMIGTDSFRTLVQTCVGVLLLLGLIRPWGIGLAACVYGVAAGIYIPASRGFVPLIVEKHNLQQSNALTTISRSAAMTIGPAIAGLLIAAVGPGPAFLLDGASFVVNVVMLSLLTVEAAKTKRQQSVRRDFADGWREVVSRPWLRWTLVVHSLWNFGIAAFYVLGPVVAQRSFGGAAAWGFISAALSVGAFVGGALALRWRPSRPLIVGNLLLLLGALPLAALALPAPLAVVVVVTLIYNAGLIVLNELWTSTEQQLIPADVLARVVSWDWLASLSSLPIGYAIIGPVAGAFGIRDAFAFGVTLMIVPVLALVCLPAIRRITMAKNGVVSDGSVAAEQVAAPVQAG
jgi:MFS family permease